MDSTVAAALVHRAIGDRLTNVFVDTGLLRRNEFHDTLELLRARLGLNVIGVDASERFLGKLAGVEDPEQKRKIIGSEFIEPFSPKSSASFSPARVPGLPVKFLVQGTLYPDVIESVSVKGPSAVIKSHHNVGGLPKDMPFALIEPLRDLFKDEVRQIGRELGLPDEILVKQPFPGTGPRRASARSGHERESSKPFARRTQSSSKKFAARAFMRRLGRRSPFFCRCAASE